MSIAAVAWALQDAPVKNAQEHVLLIALADRAHDDGRAAWPSVGWLALRGRCSVRTVQRHLAAMEARGVIRRGDSRVVAHLSADKRPTVWDLAMELKADPIPPPVLEPDPVDEEIGPPESAQVERGDNLSPRGVTAGERGDKPAPERGDKLSRGDTAMTPRGVTQLCHPNRPLEPSFNGGHLNGVPHLPAAATEPPPSESAVGCERHPGGTDEPCGGCGRVRREQAAVATALTAKRVERERRERHAGAELRARRVADCSMCDSDGYRDTALCDHEPIPSRPSLRSLVERFKAEAAERGPDPSTADPGRIAPVLNLVS